MRVSILPKSGLGWWSIGLIVTSIVVGFGSEDIISPVGISKYPIALRAAICFVFAVTGGAASVTSLISIIKKKHGAILVFVSTALGFFLLIEGVISAVQILMGTS